jgi:hypothetical protein
VICEHTSFILKFCIMPTQLFDMHYHLKGSCDYRINKTDIYLVSVRKCTIREWCTHYICMQSFILKYSILILFWNRHCILWQPNNKMFWLIFFSIVWKISYVVNLLIVLPWHVVSFYRCYLPTSILKSFSIYI